MPATAIAMGIIRPRRVGIAGVLRSRGALSDIGGGSSTIIELRHADLRNVPAVIAGTRRAGVTSRVGEHAPSIKWLRHAAHASDGGCRTLAIARYPGPWIVRTAGTRVRRRSALSVVG
jgi:hypothetical protein